MYLPPPRRHDPPPRTVVIRPESRPAVRVEPRREAPRTVVVRPEKKSGTVSAIPSQNRVPRKNDR